MNEWPPTDSDIVRVRVSQPVGFLTSVDNPTFSKSLSQLRVRAQKPALSLQSRDAPQSFMCSSNRSFHAAILKRYKHLLTPMGQEKELQAGQLIYLLAEETHSVEASEDSSFLLTMVLPKQAE
jgi:hypothetical protein